MNCCGNDIIEQCEGDYDMSQNDDYDRAALIGSMIPNMRESSRPYFTFFKIMTREFWRLV